MTAGVATDAPPVPEHRRTQAADAKILRRVAAAGAAAIAALYIVTGSGLAAVAGAIPPRLAAAALFLGVAPERTLAFEAWGVTVKLLQCRSS